MESPIERIGIRKYQIMGNDVANKADWNPEIPDNGKRCCQ